MVLTVLWPPNDPNGKTPVIVSPRSSTKNGTFIACGRCDDQVLGISWSCWMVPNKKESGEKAARGFSIFPHGADGQRRWWAEITVPAPGRYQFMATGYTKDKKDKLTATAEFEAQFASGGINGDLWILWPPESSDLVEFSDDFCPYGHLSGAGLANVILSSEDRPNEAPIEPLSFYGDGVDLEFWTAQFGTVPEGRYTLSVLDSTDNWQHVGKLRF